MTIIPCSQTELHCVSEGAGLSMQRLPQCSYSSALPTALYWYFLNYFDNSRVIEYIFKANQI